MNNIASIILGAGKGVRMESELPKVINELNGKPLIKYVVENLQIAGITNNIIVIGYKGDIVKKTLGENYTYVWQHEQLGTGHAVMQAEQSLQEYSGNIIITCGDVPLIKPDTFKAMLNEAQKEQVKAVVLTMKLENPFGYGRIIKNNGKFERIVEEKDATEDQKQVTEVNTGTYVFDKDFLFEGLKKVNTDNAQGEYYLPDALEYVLTSGYTIGTLLLANAIEGSGINTKEDLMDLEHYIAQ